MQDKTAAIHYGYNKDIQKTMAVPIYQSNAYQFDSTEHGANLFDLKELGNIYTRIMNPTVDVFEKRMAALEQGAGALAVASGMSAIFYAITNVAGAGDNIVAASQLYGGTLTQFSHTLKRFGIEVRFFDGHKPEEGEKLIDEKTKAIFIETLTNPSIDVPDIEVYAKMGDKHGIITMADNTVATPILCKPIAQGIDIVVHSASKYISGQGLAIGGVMVEKADLVNKIKGNPRYAWFNEPDVSYHGLVFTEVPFPLFTLRVRLILLRDIGAALSPFDSWLFIQGLETLAVRMKEHSNNAMKVAEFLSSHPKVQQVNYPGLSSDSNHANAQKYFKDGLASGLLSFETGSFDVAKNIADKTKIFSLVANIGDTKSIITHSASTTHRQCSDEELKAAGVSPGLIRLSVGLEDVDDLIADLTQAMA